MLDTIGFIIFGLFALYMVIKTAAAVRVVPAQEVLIVERLGRYSKSLYAGFHLLLPFIDKVVYRLSLKEEAIDVPSQTCITKDNVLVKVDGVVYMKVQDPAKAAYNVNDYHYALIQLAQTTMRAVFGQLELDKSFEERETINAKIVDVVDNAAEPWGINILRYEIQNITPPASVIESMERQMTAEREKRAVIARSEGEMQSRINRSEGARQELINKSEGEMQKMINEAEGKAAEIRNIALATASGVRQVAVALNNKGGDQAMWLNLYQEYLTKLHGMAKSETEIILPLNAANLKDILEGLRDFVESKPANPS
jgi:regulator of protease activity HflC (stomatin/prohibitin superfamily)